MVNRMRVVSSLLTTAWLAACSSARPCTIESWGTMREVLREGHSEARVALAGLGGPGVVGVGALADLAGEVTIVDDRVLVARADGASCRVDMPRPDDHASLFVRAEVDAWLDFPLLDCASYEDLDRAIAARLAQLGRDPTMPSAVRIHGRATNVAFHVIAGSCPIANPDGPSPWRFQGPLDAVELVGVYVENAAGRLTHHTHASHLHVVADGHTGHLDDIVLCDATLQLPRSAAVEFKEVR